MQVTKTTEVETAVAPARRTIKQYAGLTLRGMAMGAADIVPGVSGGTMAFILGIYEELIESIRTIGRPEFLGAVFRLRIRRALQILNWPFLLAVGLGIFISILTMSGILEWLLVNHPVYIWSFFFGLVLASTIIVARRIPRWTPSLILTTLVGAVLIYWVVGLVPSHTPNTPWFLFLSGAIASCAMILPGISGAFILFVLGKYAFVLSAVNNRDIVSLAIVAAGAAVGLITFAQVLGWTFKRYHDLTVAVLIGFMVGSLRKLWPWTVEAAWLTDDYGNVVRDSHGELIVTQHANVLPEFTTSGDILEFVLAIALVAVGIVGIVVLERMAGLKEQPAEG